MSFATNEAQQISFSDRCNVLTDREKRVLKNSWADGFSKYIFPQINEERFSVLYSSNAASRPNTPVNVIIGVLLLKEMFGSTDDELLEETLFDMRYQVALHTTSDIEQPISDRTLSRFRERLYNYEVETGIDLMKQEMEGLAGGFVKLLKISPNMKRMDSVMVSSSCKKMARLEIIYTCIANMVGAVNKTGETEILTKGLLKYLDSEDKNNTIYRVKGEQVSARLEQTVNDAIKLLNLCGDAYREFNEYRLLERVVKEQTIDDGGKIKVKPNKEITTDSLQNPSDEDATYRKKAGENHKGYVGNFVETFDENGAIITSFDYQQNTHSDSAFCKEVIEESGKQEETVTLIADGAYGSTENIQLAQENNIELVTTALTGKVPDKINADFTINEATKAIETCPAGHESVDCKYNEITDTYRAHFDKTTCENCPNRDRCSMVLQKRTALVRVSGKTIQRAAYLKKLSTKDYQIVENKRNGVEGIPSVLRRRYGVDHMPVRGLLRSKCWFDLKIGAINVMRVLAIALYKLVFIILAQKIRTYLQHGILRDCSQLIFPTAPDLLTA
jgi:hypothetical protein